MQDMLGVAVFLKGSVYMQHIMTPFLWIKGKLLKLKLMLTDWKLVSLQTLLSIQSF